MGMAMEMVMDRGALPSCLIWWISNHAACPMTGGKERAAQSSFDLLTSSPRFLLTSPSDSLGPTGASPGEASSPDLPNRHACGGLSHQNFPQSPLCNSPGCLQSGQRIGEGTPHPLPARPIFISLLPPASSVACMTFSQSASLRIPVEPPYLHPRLLFLLPWPG